MKRTESRGLRNIDSPEAPKPTRHDSCIVRYWYESQAGECLAFDSPPMTSARAHNAVAYHKSYDGSRDGMIIHAEVLLTDGRPTTRFPVRVRDPRFVRDCRVVILPSQSKE